MNPMNSTENTKETMNSTVNAVDKIISNLGTILRFFAPGFAALFVIAFVLIDTRDFLKSDYEIVAILGILLGVSIYSLHKDFITRYLWFIIVWIHRGGNPLSSYKLLNDLDEQRWYRQLSEDKIIRGMQNKLDVWSNMLNFQYCLSYIMIGIPLLARSIPCVKTNCKSYIVFIAGFLVLLVTLLSEYRMTYWEIQYKDKYKNGER